MGLAIRQLPGTNALDVARRVRDKMTELSKRFPDGVEYRIAYDITPYIRESINDVVVTLIEAIALVALVMFVFLQSWRAGLVPLLAVPVAILGTFVVMLGLGFSLNNISLLASCWPSALWWTMRSWSSRASSVGWRRDSVRATRRARAMDQVTVPIIAVGAVLVAVFVPCAFLSGITGQFFRQFAVTIAASTVFSVINSLTFSPALAAILLRPKADRPDLLTRLVNFCFGWAFGLFNRLFGSLTEGYVWGVTKLLRMSGVVVVMYGLLLLLTAGAFAEAPVDFIPQQDQGRIIVNVQTPDSASLERTNAALAQIEELTRDTPGVAHVTVVSGLSFLQQANSPNFGSMFVVLDPFEKRRSRELRDTAIMAALRDKWRDHVTDAIVTVFGAPPIPGLSVAGGFKLMIEDQGGMGLDALEQQCDRLIDELSKRPALVGLSSQFRARTPQLYFDVDRVKASLSGASVDDVNQTMAIYLGSLYVNNFNAFGRHWQVNVQAQGEYRERVEDMRLLEVRNQVGPDGALGEHCRSAIDKRTTLHHSLQPLCRGADHRHGCRRCQPWQRNQRDQPTYQRDTPVVDAR